jgi:hypothetical protein
MVVLFFMSSFFGVVAVLLQLMNLGFEHQDPVFKFVLFLLNLLQGFLKFLFCLRFFSVFNLQLVDFFSHRKHTVLVRVVHL